MAEVHRKQATSESGNPFAELAPVEPHHEHVMATASIPSLGAEFKREVSTLPEPAQSPAPQVPEAHRDSASPVEMQTSWRALDRAVEIVRDPEPTLAEAPLKSARSIFRDHDHEDEPRYTVPQQASTTALEVPQTQATERAVARAPLPDQALHHEMLGAAAIAANQPPLRDTTPNVEQPIVEPIRAEPIPRQAYSQERAADREVVPPSARSESIVEAEAAFDRRASEEALERLRAQRNQPLTGTHSTANEAAPDTDIQARRRADASLAQRLAAGSTRTDLQTAELRASPRTERSDTVKSQPPAPEPLPTGHSQALQPTPEPNEDRPIRARREPALDSRSEPVVSPGRRTDPAPSADPESKLSGPIDFESWLEDGPQLQQRLDDGIDLKNEDLRQEQGPVKERTYRFRGHRGGSSYFDRLVTLLADAIKKLEVYLLRWLERRRVRNLNAKLARKKVVTVHPLESFIKPEPKKKKRLIEKLLPFFDWR